VNEAQALREIEKIVSRETMERFLLLHKALVLWSRRFNLVAPASLAHFWFRHILDSVQLFGLAPRQAKVWLDFGSGAGFPGMVLAIMLRERPGGQMILVESNGKKASFLQHCVRITGAPATVLQQRIEDTKIKPVSVITARAVADLGQLLTWSEPISDSDTVLLFPKGKNVEQELDLARESWEIECHVLGSCTEPGAGIVKVRKFNRVQ